MTPDVFFCQAKEDLKMENQRLKDENGALIRVITKLSKWGLRKNGHQRNILTWIPPGFGFCVKERMSVCSLIMTLKLHRVATLYGTPTRKMSNPHLLSEPWCSFNICWRYSSEMLDQIETTVLTQCNAVNNLHIYDAKLLSYHIPKVLLTAGHWIQSRNSWQWWTINPSYNFLYVLPPALTATEVFLCVSQLLWGRSVLDHSLQTLDVVVHENASEKQTKNSFWNI